MDPLDGKVITAPVIRAEVSSFVAISFGQDVTDQALHDLSSDIERAVSGNRR